MLRYEGHHLSIRRQISLLTSLAVSDLAAGLVSQALFVAKVLSENTTKFTCAHFGSVLKFGVNLRRYSNEFRSLACSLIAFYLCYSDGQPAC